MAAVLLVSAAALAAIFLASWIISLRLEDVSIVDITWGLGFVAVAWVAMALGEGDLDRRLLVAALVTVWGLRLSLHIGRRKLGEPQEDRRYQRMRSRHPGSFRLVSLGKVFGLQAVIAWVVALPVMAQSSSDTSLGLVALVGAAVFAIGLFFEAVGDLQLQRFKRDPANRGQVMDRGLWRYTRHPNYFGDFLVWWGLYLVAVEAGAWWTVVAPLLMSVLLIRVSGKGLLESTITARRPGYADYVRRTSGFVPLPPRGD